MKNHSLRLLTCLVVCATGAACAKPARKKFLNHPVGATTSKVEEGEQTIEESNASEPAQADADQNPHAGIPGMDGEDTSPDDMPPAGPQMPESPLPAAVVLSAAALEQSFRPVFGNTPRDRSSLEDNYFKRVPTAFFTEAQKQILGNWRIMGSDDVLRTAWRTNVDQEYLQTLREFLGDACAKLVDDERLIATETPSASTVLVQGDVPTKEKIHSFMSRLYGYNTEGGFHSSTSELHAIFSRSVQAGAALAAAQKSNLIRQNYILLCVTVGSDPRAYMR